MLKALTEKLCVFRGACKPSSYLQVVSSRQLHAASTGLKAGANPTAEDDAAGNVFLSSLLPSHPPCHL